MIGGDREEKIHFMKNSTYCYLLPVTFNLMAFLKTTRTHVSLTLVIDISRKLEEILNMLKK